jgi:hypothetical protein
MLQRTRKSLNSRYVTGVLCGSLLILSGCGSTSLSHPSSTKQISSRTNSVTLLKSKKPSNTKNHAATNNMNEGQSAETNLFQTTLRLPNGKVITPNHTVDWKDLYIQLIVTSLPPSTTNGFEAVVGNHSTIISHQTVSTPAGKATLVLDQRTAPAASKSTTPTYEYWVIVYGNQYAYAIDAMVSGNLNNAKSNVMGLLKQWKVPQ